MKRQDIPALFQVLAWTTAIGVGLASGTGIPLSKGTAKPLGFLLFLLGMSFFAWGVAHLRGAFLRNVEPRTDTLTTTGPYRFARHPVYLGMVVSSLGLTIGMTSLWGVAFVFLLLVPASIYRARLEEAALARRFGEEWKKYANGTYFMFPHFW